MHQIPRNAIRFRSADPAYDQGNGIIRRHHADKRRRPLPVSPPIGRNHLLFRDMVHTEKPKLFTGRCIHGLAKTNSQSRDLALKSASEPSERESRRAITQTKSSR